MVTCAVMSCKNSSAKLSKANDGITFHRFPKDTQRRKQWEIAICRKEDWTASSSSAICSEHFSTTDFYLTESGLRRLSSDAMPIINMSPCQQPEVTISQLQPVDIKPTDTEEVIKLKHKVRRLEIISENRRRSLNRVKMSRTRLKKKLAQMKTMIKHLIQIKNNKNFEVHFV